MQAGTNEHTARNGDSFLPSFALSSIPDTRDPLSSVHPFYMLIETSGADESHDHAKLSGFLERALESP